MVTKDAMTTMNEGIRTRRGMKFLRAEMTTLEQTRTKVVAKPIPIPLMAVVVTARVGHMPKTKRNMGFSLQKPLVNSLTMAIVLSLLTGAQNSCLMISIEFQTLLNCLDHSPRRDRRPRYPIDIAPVLFDCPCGIG